MTVTLNDMLLEILALAIKNQDIHYTYNTGAYSWRMPNTKVWNHCDTFVECLHDMVKNNYPFN